MTPSSNPTYFKLLSNFITTVDSSAKLDEIDLDDDILEFTAGNLVMRLMPHKSHPEKEADYIAIDADLMKLNLENRDMNHNRFLILHQLNCASRLTTGIIAFISERGMLSIGKIISLVGLDADELATEVQKVMQAGDNLYQAWNQLAEEYIKNAE